MALVKKDVIVFNVIGYIVISVLVVLSLVPFWVTLSGSFTAENNLLAEGYRLIPTHFSTEAYSLVFKYPEAIFRAYGVSISLVLLGTVIGLFITAMTSYVLQRKDFKYRNRLSYFFFFTTLFSSGIVPWYIFMVKLGMNNNYLLLLLPNMVNVFNIIVMRTFFKTVPESIGESAKIDGAGDFLVFLRLYLPMSKPALATIGLFIALSYWNDWYLAMLFITKSHMFPLQYLLYRIFNSMQHAQAVAQKAGMPLAEMPKESFKLAMAIVVTGPVILFYPFFQNYFVKGIMVGAVKG